MLAALVIGWQAGSCWAAAPAQQPVGWSESESESLRLAIADLMETFGQRYPNGQAYLDRLNTLEAAALRGSRPAAADLEKLKRQALSANPLLDFDELILLKRKRGQLGLPTNHQCNSCLEQSGYENEIAVLSPVRAEGQLETLFRPPGGFYLGEFDLDFDGRTLLFTMPNGKSWQIHQIGVDGDGLRQVSREEPGVDNFDACYLPDGRIVFASTASYTGVPCWHGKERACSIYVMNADGSGMRQLCFDQDLDLHPAVLPNGQVIYSRWDYTGIMHIYVRLLMVMNPDGSSQRAVYGSNSYYPNALYFPQAVPGTRNKMVAILSGYHGVNRMGELVLLDTSQGWHEAQGIVQRIAHRNEPPVPVIRDRLVDNSWPKFLHPRPLSEKYFLAAAQLSNNAPWGIYLVDVFDNVLPLCFDGKFDFFEPIPVTSRPKPPSIPSRVDTSRDDAVVYLHDVYAGPGLDGVPRGSVKRLRIVAYHFGYPGMAGPDKIGRGGPWEAMRILGTVPVNEDGSVVFRVPANTPITIQPLDERGRALQLMRSWYTAMPGEKTSCVGCHEHPKDTPHVRRETAATRLPLEIEPWYGPARGFDFEREVQPVLDEYCVGCHDGQLNDKGQTIPDLRAERFADNYRGLPLTKLGADRLEPEVREKLPPFAATAKQPYGATRMLYTPAYDALIPYVRRVNVEDYVGLHVPGEYHASTSELIQMLEKGHHNVRLDEEAWDRLYTWIDLNGPCHGTWGDVCKIPYGADRRRRQLALKYGGPSADPEAVPVVSAKPVEPIIPEPLPKPDRERIKLAGWPFDSEEARRRQAVLGESEKLVDLGGGLGLKLARIPSGEFVIGSNDGEVDERPATPVTIRRDFWIGACEITNRQYRCFDPSHNPGVFVKRSQDVNGPGIALDGPRQPVVRVSWRQATAFCEWLSLKTGLRFRLPNEAEWEYACRAGSSSDLSWGDLGHSWGDLGHSWGDLGDEFSAWANVADLSLSKVYNNTGGVFLLQNIPCNVNLDDKAIATANVAGYGPNPWGLYDVHGNVAEWTSSTYRPYPYREDNRGELPGDPGHKVVRGGSFHDRVKRCRSAFRLSYPAWQRVHDVGFRVLCEEANAQTTTLAESAGAGRPR